MQNRIIQWNCRGLKANDEETLLLLKDYEPAALCLQETHLKDSDNASIRNYTAFHTFSTSSERAAGGVSIFVNNNAPHSHIPLKRNLQAVAFSMTLHRVITLCSAFSGWSGGAMVLGKLPVPGRPTNLDRSRARVYCACSGCGWGLFGHFYSRLSFLFSSSLSLGDGPI